MAAGVDLAMRDDNGETGSSASTSRMSMVAETERRSMSMQAGIEIEAGFLAQFAGPCRILELSPGSGPAGRAP